MPTILLKALAIWLLLIIAEAIHGAFREAFLKKRLGDKRARQVCVFSGAAIVLVITLLTLGWFGDPSLATLLAIGALWVGLTVAFELAIGRWAMGLSWKRLGEDFDLRRGGLLPIGLLIMFLSPLLASMLLNSLGI